MSLLSFKAELESVSLVVCLHTWSGVNVVEFPAGRYPGDVALPVVRELLARNGLKVVRVHPENPQPTVEGDFRIWPTVLFYVEEAP